MEKSVVQLKHVERISRQMRNHWTHSNQTCNRNLQTRLDHLANERKRSILSAISRQELEEERKKIVNLTVKQIARERQQQSFRTSETQTEQETIQRLSKNDENRPPSSVKLLNAETSCDLFSHNCQLYPCQPVYQYTSFITQEHDQTLRKRNLSIENLTNTSSVLYSQELSKIVQGRREKDHRQLASAIRNQNHLTNRHVSMKRAMATLDEQSYLLHERLSDKKTFDYNKQRQNQLSRAI